MERKERGASAAWAAPAVAPLPASGLYRQAALPRSGETSAIVFPRPRAAFLAAVVVALALALALAASALLTYTRKAIAHGQVVMAATPGVDVFVLSRHVGPLAAGQHVAVEVEAFPAQHFGLLSGRIESISDQPVQDVPRDLLPTQGVPASDIFRVRVRLDGVTGAQGRPLHLRQGMKVRASIALETRPVLDWLVPRLERAAQGQA